MTTTTYIIAWLVYLSAAAVMNIIFWKLSTAWSQDLRTACRALLVIVLFTPYFSDPGQYKLAPAFLITFFELVFGDPQIAFRASMPIVILLLVCVTFLFIIHLVRRRKK